MKRKLHPELACPNCSSDRIHSEDIYDIEGAYIEGESALVEKCVGVCRKCNKQLQWEQVYKFVGFRDIVTDETDTD